MDTTKDKGSQFINRQRTISNNSMNTIATMKGARVTCMELIKPKYNKNQTKDIIQDMSIALTRTECIRI